MISSRKLVAFGMALAPTVGFKEPAASARFEILEEADMPANRILFLGLPLSGRSRASWKCSSYTGEHVPPCLNNLMIRCFAGNSLSLAAKIP